MTLYSFFNGEYFYSSNTLSFQENYHTWLQVLNGALINTLISPKLKLLWEMRSETWFNTGDTSQRLKREGTQKALVTFVHGGHSLWTLKPDLPEIAMAEPAADAKPSSIAACPSAPHLGNDKQELSHFLFNRVSSTFPTPVSLRQASCPPLPGRRAEGLALLQPAPEAADSRCRNTGTGSSTSLRAESRLSHGALPRLQQRLCLAGNADRKMRVTNTSQSCFGLRELLQG